MLGYCLLPLSIALALCRVVLLVQQTTFFFLLRCGFTLTSFGWAVWGKSQPFDYNALRSPSLLIFLPLVSWHSGNQISWRLISATPESPGCLSDWSLLLCHRLASCISVKFLRSFVLNRHFSAHGFRNQINNFPNRLRHRIKWLTQRWSALHLISDRSGGQCWRTGRSNWVTRSVC